MKKAAGFIVLLIFMTGLIGCSGKTVKLDLPQGVRSLDGDSFTLRFGRKPPAGTPAAP